MRRTDPFDLPPQYRRLRAEQPVARVRTPSGEAWLITRYQDVRAVLTDCRFSANPSTPGFPTFLSGDVTPPPGFFLQADEANHARMRRAVSREFLLGHMEALRPLMRAIVDQQLDDLLAGPVPADFIDKVARPVSSVVICELLGVPHSDYPFFESRIQTTLMRAGTTEEEIGAAAVELQAYIGKLVHDAIKEPGGDLLGRLVLAGDVTEEEMVGVVALLLLAGYDTVTQTTGIGLLTLLRNPDQLAALRADPSLYPNAVDEILRYCTANHLGLPRAARCDVEVGGIEIKAGEGVIVLIDSANRDEAAFTDPDVFDVRRVRAPHMTFGFGFHKCIGLMMARIELETMLRVVLTRLPGLRLAAEIDELVFRQDNLLYGVEQLPIAW
ncbi:cytochrome P450 [Lentzea sp. NBRC 105346]|uniref:cytochrome P450 n=1 Tax=Lentzea sp. NBRC 105346 TaxID=3032205 RepID=UPI0024A243CD|nr:cytochrome P450 [Lentzea sp. NBRC 105346]GLZ33778.1 cytochrome P450 [Lentzea sp. NBRC 105346]